VAPARKGLGHDTHDTQLSRGRELKYSIAPTTPSLASSLRKAPLVEVVRSGPGPCWCSLGFPYVEEKRRILGKRRALLGGATLKPQASRAR